MKKIISLIVAIGMVVTGNISTVLADESIQDHVPGEKNVNLIPDSTEGNGFMYFGTRIAKAQYSDWGTSTEGGLNAFKYSYTETGDLVLTNNWGGFEGFFLNRNRGDGEGNFGFTPEAGKTYVFKANVKNASVDGVTPSFGIALNGTWGPANIVATNEYGTEGMELSDEWKEFKGTLSLPSSFSDDTGYGCTPLVGFAAGAPEGSAFWLDVSEKDSVYFAEEQAYDVKIEKMGEDGAIPVGTSVTFKAEAVNQIDIPGNLQQNFVWGVLNSDKNNVAEGFEVPEIPTQEVSIKVTEAVEPGDYYVLAVSGDYGMIKTHKITVGAKDPFKEYEKGVKNPNLIPDATNWKWLGARNNGSIQNAEGGGSGSVTTSTKYYYEGTNDLALENAWRGFEGFELNSVQLSESEKWFEPEPGKTYVISMNLKNVSSNGVTPYFGSAINGTYGPANLKYTNEYGKNGMAVEGSDWIKFNASITLPKNFSADTPYGKSIFMGFPQGTKPGAAVLIDRTTKDSTYIAEEQLFDIINEIENEEEVIRAGDTISLSARVVNQIGTTGGFKQNFRWFASDEAKENLVDGFEFIAEGNKVSVKISDDVEPGTYYIYAESADYADMRRAVKIDVQKSLIGDRENISDNKNDAKKIIIESNVDDDIVEMTDEYVLKATLLNQEDLPGELEQEFNWYVINNDQATVAEGITLEKLDKQNAKVKISLYAEPGEYYAVAESVNYEGIRKIYKFTVDKPTATEAAVELINSESAEKLAENLPEYLDVLGIQGEYAEKADMQELSKLISEIAKKQAFTAENAKGEVAKLAVISLYNSNPEKVELYNEKGEFNFGDILGIDEYCKGTTLKEVFEEILSDDGKVEVQKELTGKDLKDEDEFFKVFSESLILNSIESPSVMGTEYIEKVLTEDNAKKAGINIDKYLNLKKKSSANKTLARNSYTKATLESTISNLKESSGGGTGNTGGGNKGSSAPVSPSVITQNPQILPSTQTDAFDMFSDVTEKHWAYDQIYHLKKIGVVSGVDGNNFKPEANVTREQFVKMFIDALEFEKTNSELPYKDVDVGAWYYAYLSTAHEKGLINGISNTEFGIGKYITRQDICVIAVRAMGVETEEEPVGIFTDFDTVSDYAKASVKYLSDYGVVNGFSDGSFMPKENCTRAQAAKIICTLMNLGGVSE